MTLLKNAPPWYSAVTFTFSREGTVGSFSKSLFWLAAFLALSFAFFHLALDNSFWHRDDFGYLDHNLRMTTGKLALFDSEPPLKFQPLVYGISYVLFHQFGFDPRGYFLFNILLHGLNSFLVYLLVRTLLRDGVVAAVSAVLFAFTVGSYGKAIMIMSGLEDLVITTLTLLTMIFYFKNELEGQGRTRSPWFLLSLVFFVGSMFTRSTSFAILGAFLAFNYFFRGDTGHRVLGRNFVILLVIAAAALVVKTQVFHYRPPFYAAESPGPLAAAYSAGKNIINYLVRMIFPVHTSHLVAEAGPVVRFIYGFATAIRVLIALLVVSYSFFGFIFGNHTIRFFIAWTYIMAFPFAFFQFPGDWLNIRHLYLVSIGLAMVLAAGAVYCSRLIAHQRWRRFVPFVVPLFFILMARFIVRELDRSYEHKAASAVTAEYRKALVQKYPWVIIDAGRLRYGPDVPPDAAGARRP